MRIFLRCLLYIVWALWFGGVMGLFLSVQVLFHQTERAVFLDSAPKLFIAFEKYQIALAILGLLTAMVWRGIEARRALTVVLVLLGLATVGAVVEMTQITPRIESMRLAGQTHTPRFMQMHGISMMVYMSVAITLLIAGILQAIPGKFQGVSDAAPVDSARV
jgi:hypothetical protein